MRKKPEDIARHLGGFLRQYARPASNNTDPNDRGYDRRLERRIKRLDPVTLDLMMRGELDDGDAAAEEAVAEDGSDAK